MSPAKGARRRALAGAIVLLVASGMTAAATDSVSGARERFVAEPPPGWKMSYRYGVAGFEVWEFLPRDQSLENWRDMITAQAISGEESNSPRTLLALVAERAHGICLEALSSPIDEQLADGFAAATMAQFCLRSAQARRGDVTLYRAIHGADALYVLSRTRRDEAYDGRTIPLPEEAMAQWKEELRGFRVCRQNDDCGTPD